MAEILSAETLKSTKVGNIEEAKNIIKKLMAAEKDQTKTSKPNAAKLKKWQTAITAYDQTEKKARTLYDKIKTNKPELLNGKDVLNLTINEMQASLNKLDPKEREAILNGSGIDQIQDVQLSNDWYEKGGGLSNFGNDIVKGGDKSVALSKAFTGVAIASFAVSGINSIFGAGTVGSLLATHIPQAVSLAGTALKALWGFSPLGTAMLGAMVALKVIPTIARFVNKMKNKYAALTRANTMKNKLAELAEQDGPSVEFENEYTAHDSGKGEHTHTPGGNSGKNPGHTGSPNPDKPQSLRERMKGKPSKEQTAMFKNASLEEQIGYARESLEQCESDILGIEKNVNEIVAQYNQTTDSKTKRGLESTLSISASQAANVTSELRSTLSIINTLLTSNPGNAELQALQKSAFEKVNTLTAKSKAIQTACKKKEPIQIEEENTADEKKIKNSTRTPGGDKKSGKKEGVESENEGPSHPLDFLPPVSQAKMEAAQAAYKAACSELETLLESADGGVVPKKLIIQQDGIEYDQGYSSGMKEDGTPKTTAEIDSEMQRVKEAKAQLDARIEQLKETIKKAKGEMSEALKTSKGLGKDKEVEAFEELLVTESSRREGLITSGIEKVNNSFESYMAEANENLGYAKADDALKYAVERFEPLAKNLEKLLTETTPDYQKLAKAKENLSSAYTLISKYATSEVAGRMGGTIENIDPEKLAEIEGKYNDLIGKYSNILNAKVSEDKFNAGVQRIQGHMNTFNAAVKAKDMAQALLSLTGMDAELEALAEIANTNPKFKTQYGKLEAEINQKHSIYQDKKTFQTTAQKFPAARQFIQKFVYANGFGNNTHVLNNLEEAVSKIGSPTCVTELRGVMKGSEEEQFLKEFVEKLRAQEKEKGKGLEGSRDPAARKALEDQGLEEADIESIIGKGK